MVEKPTIVIDIDGVIATGTVEEVYSEKAGWAYEKCSLVEGAVEALAELHEKYRIVLSTARWATDERKTRLWLEEKGIDKYVDHLDIGRKFSAVAYIDDKGYRFKDWKQTLEDFANPSLLGLTPEGVE